ncbi:MAG: TauD/TfdA family dioxygenase, partial [Sciscionella sp.]
LLTVQISSYGPFTLFMSLEDIKRILPRTVLDELARPQWPFRYGYDAILRNEESTAFFNPQVIERWSSRFPIKREPAKRALRSLIEVAIHENATELPTETGDCVIAKNTHVLHGRAAVSEDVLRVLKRIRFNRKRKAVP